MLRVLRIAVVVIFIITSVVFAFFFISEKLNTDTTIPVITIEEDMLEVGFDADDEDLLKGVTAYDEKDKDITDKIIIESVSKFIEDGVCRVTYAVCDNDNNVASATRKIRYKNYVPPKITLNAPACFSIFEAVDIGAIVEATDCIEGDISENIHVTSDDYTVKIAGVYSIDVSVTNSKGDSSSVKIPLIVEDRSVAAPKIILDEYLIYLEKGAEVDFSDYIDEVVDVRDNKISAKVRIETNINLKKPGTYAVHYYVTDDAGVEGHTVLNVVVSE